ncbi:variable surface protein [Plasmodium gonderi]|uniref:Variable surface protein n=1 Tax=Plasmodium gonderi TaxID=77519 RepID=A0A1Y1JTU5_PLAGO|nr:variable surface protein [Plasmodium gonderi]GAW84537.1 variable surface protein [Plasmodium gonderi]
MSKNDEAFDFDGFIKKLCSVSTKLKNSELHKFYSSIDHIEVKKDLTSEICTRESSEDLSNLCHHVKSIINQWKKFCSYTEQKQGKCCDYLNYWLYGKIAEKNLSFPDLAWIYNEINTILYKYHSKSKDEYLCKNKIKIITSKDELKKKKVLYDFLEYYDSIKGVLSNNKEVKELVCTYVSYVLSLYNKLEEDRKSGFLHRYNNELEQFRKIFNDEYILSLLNENCNISESFIRTLKSAKNLKSLHGNYGEHNAIRNKLSDYVEYKPEFKNGYESVLKMLPSSEIYKQLNNEVTEELGKNILDIKGKNYDYTYCNSLNGEMRPICKKLVRNLHKLQNIDNLDKENHRDRCTYLNFWMYDEFSKVYKNTDENILDVPDVADLIAANIKINNYLIKEDLNKNYHLRVREPRPRKNGQITNQTAGNVHVTQVLSDIEAPQALPEDKTHPEFKRNKDSRESMRPGHAMEELDPELTTYYYKKEQEDSKPVNVVSYKELTEYEPCFFNYNCRFKECAEMKHLYEYFKNHEEIKNKINCENIQNNEYISYLKYMSLLHKNHKNECCSWGAELCPSYFLRCDESYDPQKFLSALKSGDKNKCEEIMQLIKHNKSDDVFNVNPNSEENMFIKYFTCSEVTNSNFEKSGLRCQQPSYSSHLNNQHYPVRPINKRQSNEGLYGKKITINGKSINVVLLTDPYAKITGKNLTDTSTVKNGYTLFPEVQGLARKSYIKEAETACENERPKKGMEEYCKRSKTYNNQTRSAHFQFKNIIQGNGVKILGENTIPIDISFTNSVLQNFFFRIGVIILIALGAIFVFILYYKFTPFGSWLRYRIKGGRRKKKNIHYRELREESSNYVIDYMREHPPKKRINIVYQN